MQVQRGDIIWLWPCVCSRVAILQGSREYRKKETRTGNLCPGQKNKKGPKPKQTNQPRYHFVLVLAESWVQTLSFGSGSGRIFIKTNKTQNQTSPKKALLSFQ